MKKAAVVLGSCMVVALLAGAVPDAVESAVPTLKTVYASVRDYTECVTGKGALTYLSQGDVTSALPLVIERFVVEEGDVVSVGDTLAVVDREATASMIESLGQVSQLAVAAANLSTAVALIPDTVTADREGRVLSVAGNGAAVESGYSIACIAGSDELAVSAAISELDIAKVKVGQRVNFTCSAYPETVFTGSVSKIASAARNQYSGAVLETVVDILIKPDERDERLRSGLTTEVYVLLGEPRKICVLPYEVIEQDERGEYIYVYEDGEAVRRNVFTGAEFVDGTEIISGVEPAEPVFASPSEVAGRSFIRMEEQY